MPKPILIGCLSCAAAGAIAPNAASATIRPTNVAVFSDSETWHASQTNYDFENF
jgi:hypothetical protein